MDRAGCGTAIERWLAKRTAPEGAVSFWGRWIGIREVSSGAGDARTVSA